MIKFYININMSKQINLLLAAIVCVFFISSCASLTGFEEGRVLGEENSEITVSGNFTRVPDLFEDEFNAEIDSLNSAISFPNLELSFKRGITDKLDAGVRVSSNLNGSMFMKYQVVGDRSSSFALSPGFEAGTILGFAYNVGIPIYATYYPVEAVAINLTPRFMYQFITGAETSGASYLGGNFGLLFGKRNKFGIDIGYYKVGIGNGSQPLFTVGLGGKFSFGDGYSSSTNKNRKR